MKKGTGSIKPKRGKDANYDFARQKEPIDRLGAKSFANMPEQPIIQSYDNQDNYRGGTQSGEPQPLEKVSKIHENWD